MEKKNNGSNDTYLLIDDVEIYGANPYAVYKEPEPEKGPEPIPGLNYFASVGGLVNVQLNIKDNNAAELKSTGLNMTVNGTYAVQDDKVTFTFDGGVTYVTTISEDSKTLTYSSVSGEGAVANALRNLSFNMINYADNAETYEDDDGETHTRHHLITVTAVGKNAFADKEFIASVSFHDRIKTIGVDAFRGCTALKSFKTPSSLQSLGSYALSGCTGLETAEINGNTRATTGGF